MSIKNKLTHKVCKTLLFIALLVITVQGKALTFASERGEAGQAAAYLKMGIGARAIGMGGAYAAIADDSTAVHWNPAGLARLEKDEIHTMHAVMNLDRSLDFVNYAHKLEEGSVWAFSWTSFGVDKIEERAGDNDPNGNAPGQLLGYFDDTESSFAGSYAWNVKPDIDLGITLKYLHQTLADASARSFAMDLGVLYTVNPRFAFGAVVKELASDLRWDTGGDHTDPIPFGARAGMMFKARPSLTFAFDVSKYQEADAQVHFGIEGWIQDLFALRAGIDEGDLSLGSSFKYREYRISAGYKF
jgi:long-subunit fatty acid transport protein